MDETHNWRQMFDRNGRGRQPERDSQYGNNAGDTSRSGAYDDGYQPQADSPAPMSPSDITDEAALALAAAEDVSEYRPWILQRGRSRPALMLHLRRYDPKSGFWLGWELSYPHLVAVEYTGEQLLSLDFGSRQFMLEGTGLIELVQHLQTGSVLMVQEYAPCVWPGQPDGPRVSAIRRLAST